MRHLKNKIRPKPLSILTYMKNNNKSYPQKYFSAYGTFVSVDASCLGKKRKDEKEGKK